MKELAFQLNSLERQGHSYIDLFHASACGISSLQRMCGLWTDIVDFACQKWSLNCMCPVWVALYYSRWDIKYVYFCPQRGLGFWISTRLYLEQIYLSTSNDILIPGVIYKKYYMLLMPDLHIARKHSQNEGTWVWHSVNHDSDYTFWEPNSDALTISCDDYLRASIPSESSCMGQTFGEWTWRSAFTVDMSSYESLLSATSHHRWYVQRTYGDDLNLGL